MANKELRINCGFARVAVKELTPRIRNQTDFGKRASEFQALFEDTPNFLRDLPPTYFQPTTHGKDPSLYDEDCTKILDSFGKR